MHDPRAGCGSIFDSLSAEPFFTDTMDSFNLSAVDRAEVMRIKSKGRPRYATELEKLSETTTNVGMQYLMISEWYTIQSALINLNLDRRVVMLLFDAIKSNSPWVRFDDIRPFTMITYRAIETLIMSRVVAADLTLFRRAFSALEYFNVNGVSSEHATSYNILFHNVLYRHSTIIKNRDMSMSVGTLLFVLTSLHNLPRGVISPMLEELRDSIIENRRAEIRAWIEENMPYYVDFPLSWIYEVFDLHV